MKPSRFAILLLVVLTLAFLARLGGAAQNRRAVPMANSQPAPSLSAPLSAPAIQAAP